MPIIAEKLEFVKMNTVKVCAKAAIESGSESKNRVFVVFSEKNEKMNIFCNVLDFTTS